MANWLLLFQPFAADGPFSRFKESYAAYIPPNDEIKKGDLVYWIAGSYGLAGWGYVRKISVDRMNKDGKGMLIEVMFDQMRANIATEGEIGQFPILVDARKRAEGNLVRLEAREFNELNRILRERNVESPEDVPEFEVRIGNFGVKDSSSLNFETKRAVQEFGCVSLLFMDLDNFKRVNDENSHALGDKVIKEALTEVGIVVGSLGELFHRSGDEMIVLLPNIGDLAAMEIAESVRSAIEQKEFSVVGQGLVTTTIGVATYPTDCENWEFLEETADHRMIELKKIRKNSISNH